ncbi:MAG: hypothetical protein AB7S68_08295 [Polyangiaceae bacterium]
MRKGRGAGGVERLVAPRLPNRIAVVSWRSAWVCAWVLIGCGSQAAGQLAAETAGALIDGATKGSSQPNPEFRAEGPYCALWKGADRACPVLPDCSRLASSRRLSTNACVRNDRVMPVTSCIGDRWNQYQPRVCQSGEFPGCAGLVGESCWEYDEVVCTERGGNKRLLECCVGARPDCVTNTYSLVSPRSSSPPKEDGEALPDGSTGGSEEVDAGSDAGGD